MRMSSNEDELADDIIEDSEDVLGAAVVRVLERSFDTVWELKNGDENPL